jgi:phospholipid/cholesterol/gamma-HCH transport system substrate-binding protein
VDRPSSRERLNYLVRGAVAFTLALGVAAVMVLRGTGALDRTEDVFVEVPSAVGLVNAGAPVRYLGVDIGRIASIEAGATESRVRLAIDVDASRTIPSDVLARVVPRTFFGDIYVELVTDTGEENAARGSSARTEAVALAEVDSIAVDTGPEAVAMYDVFTRMSSVLEQMQPQEMAKALDALGRALDGNGETIGRTIDRLAATTDQLTPSLNGFIDATPQFVTVMESLQAATPDMVGMLSAATEVSRAIVEHRGDLADTMGAATLLAASVDGFTGPRLDTMITVTDSIGTILATTGADPDGLYATLANAETFGAAGARVFGSGRFDITAVPTFAGPLPYTAADCPSYGSLTGANCNSPGNGSYSAAKPVINAAAEAGPLQLLEQQLRGEPAAAPAEQGTAEPTGPHAAVTALLAPLFRGSEVRIP